MKEDKKLVCVRMPSDIRKELEKEAAAQERTLSQQILFVLKAFVAESKTPAE